MENEFTLAYKEHYQKLYTLAFRMTGSKEDSEDILQTSFLNALIIGFNYLESIKSKRLQIK